MGFLFVSMRPSKDTLKSKTQRTAMDISNRVKQSVDFVRLVWSTVLPPPTDASDKPPPGCEGENKSPTNPTKTTMRGAVVGLGATFKGNSTSDYDVTTIPTYESHKNAALRHAVYSGNEEVVKRDLASRIDVDTMDNKGSTPLLYAAQHGHEKIAKQLLQIGSIDLNTKCKSGHTPLSWAALSGYGEVVKLLLQTPGLDVSCTCPNGLTPLSWAAKQGHEGVVAIFRDLLCEGDTPAGTRSPTHGETFDQSVGVAEEQKGLDVNHKDKGGYTPLLWATVGGHDKVVKELLKFGGIDVNGTDGDGRAAFLWAVSKGYVSIVDLLLQEA